MGFITYVMESVNTFNLQCMYVCMYMYVCMCVCVTDMVYSYFIKVLNCGDNPAMLLFLASGHRHIYFCGVPAKVHVPIP